MKKDAYAVLSESWNKLTRNFKIIFCSVLKVKGIHGNRPVYLLHYSLKVCCILNEYKKKLKILVIEFFPLCNQTFDLILRAVERSQCRMCVSIAIFSKDGNDVKPKSMRVFDSTIH